MRHDITATHAVPMPEAQKCAYCSLASMSGTFGVTSIGAGGLDTLTMRIVTPGVGRLAARLDGACSSSCSRALTALTRAISLLPHAAIPARIVSLRAQSARRFAARSRSTRPTTSGRSNQRRNVSGRKPLARAATTKSHCSSSSQTSFRQAARTDRGIPRGRLVGERGPEAASGAVIVPIPEFSGRWRPF